MMLFFCSSLSSQSYCHCSTTTTTTKTANTLPAWFLGSLCVLLFVYVSACICATVNLWVYVCVCVFDYLFVQSVIKWWLLDEMLVSWQLSLIRWERHRVLCCHTQRRMLSKLNTAAACLTTSMATTIVVKTIEMWGTCSIEWHYKRSGLTNDWQKMTIDISGFGQGFHWISDFLLDSILCYFKCD